MKKNRLLLALTLGLALVSAQDLTAGGAKEATKSPVALAAAAGTVEARKISSAPVVDGKLNESLWNLDRRVEKAVIGTNDNTISFGTLWDETYLYVGVKVIDANLHNDSDGIWDDDSVEVYIDANRSRGVAYDDFDRQFQKGYDDSSLRERAFKTEGVLHGWAPIDGGYSVELAVPWRSLGIVPAAGTVIGFDVAVNDDDDGAKRENQIMWFGTKDNWQDTSGFGDCLLTDGSAVSGAPAPRAAAGSAATAAPAATPTAASVPVRAPTVVPVTKSIPAKPQAIVPAAGDRFVTVAGAGKKDGSDWANALEGNREGGLQAAWNSVAQTGTLYVGGGVYDVKQTLRINTENDGVSTSALKKLQGVDTGRGLPLFTGGTFKASDPVPNLVHLIVAETGASYWRIADITVKEYYSAIWTDGKNVGYRIYNVDASYVGDGLFLKGGGSPVTRAQAQAKQYSTDGSHDIVIEDCDFDHYAKRGLRLRDGTYDVVVRRCTADGGGADFWDPKNFQISFEVGDSNQINGWAKDAVVYDYNIEFYDCVGANNYTEVNTGTRYWNGDGFSAERATDNVRYYRCVAINSTDGGWDCKTKNVYLYDCVAVGNKRGFRFWSDERAELNNCISLNNYTHGGTVTNAGVWGASPQGGFGAAQLVLNNCTIFNNGRTKIENEGAADIVANDCIIGQDPATKNSLLYMGTVTANRSEEYIAGVRGTNPAFVAPVDGFWDGRGDNWDSRAFGASKGYRHKLP